MALPPINYPGAPYYYVPGVGWQRRAARRAAPAPRPVRRKRRRGFPNVRETWPELGGADRWD
jgi:hypothetical protein